MLEGEAHVIKQIQDGETERFGALYDHYSPQIFRFTLLKVGDKEEAEDITHQVFLKALEGIGNYADSGNPFSSWLYRITRNQIVDFWRSNGKGNLSLERTDPEVFTGLANVSDQTEDKLALDKVRTALGHLRPEYQDVIILRFVEEMSLKETAEALEKTIGAVKLLQYRALESLRKRLKANEPVSKPTTT